MILPTELVKALDIDPHAVLLLLRIKGIDDIYLKIIRQKDLAEKNTENMIPAADKFLKPSQQESSGALPEIIKGGGSGEDWK